LKNLMKILSTMKSIIKIPYIVLCLVLSAACAPDPSSWEVAARSVRADFAEHSRVSLAYSESDILAGLEASPFNGFCLLLDQVIAPALSSLELPPAGSGELTAFEFPRDAQKFTSPSGSVSSRERSVVFETSKRGYLVNKGLLNIARDDLSEIEIRARIKTGSALRIGCSGDFIEWKPGRMALANIPVDPQEEYRVYCLNLSQSVFRRSLPSGGKLNKIFLAPGDWPGGEIEIASIRFLGRGARYLKSPYGTGYLTSGEVTRPGFWMPVPGRLSWEIELPSQPTFLRAGVSLFQESRPGIEYEIRIVSAEATTLLKRGILSLVIHLPGWIWGVWI